MHKFFPHLLGDITPPTNIIAQQALTALWIAEAGVVDNLHQEPLDHLFSVIKGSQRVTLIPSSRYSELYPRTNSTDSLMVSQVGRVALYTLITSSHLSVD
jgi:hypothetical protein